MTRMKLQSESRPSDRGKFDANKKGRFAKRTRGLPLWKPRNEFAGFDLAAVQQKAQRHIAPWGRSPRPGELEDCGGAWNREAR
jgi:hypothetical protein